MKGTSHESSLKIRLDRMLMECKKWKPSTEEERRDKLMIVNTLNYAISGKLKHKQQKVKDVV